MLDTGHAADIAENPLGHAPLPTDARRNGSSPPDAGAHDTRTVAPTTATEPGSASTPAEIEHSAFNSICELVKCCNAHHTLHKMELPRRERFFAPHRHIAP